MTSKVKSMHSQKKLYGLRKYYMDLVKLFDIEKLPKVLMLSGKKGQGKFTLTHHLMSYIFDKKNYDLNSTTITELNKLFSDIKDNNNTNVIYYSCSDKNVKIDDIRKLRINLQKSSISNLQRFIIFDDVEHLNTNCVNALLKTIEEPSYTNYFILINNQNNMILDTLKSRSIEILFFLNKKEKNDITKKILSDFQIEEKIDLNNSSLTPGNYLKYNKIILDEKIELNEKLIINLEKLLKLNKFKKNIDYLNFAIYLIDHHYFNKFKNSSNLFNYNDKRISIIKKIYESNQLNLNYSNLITEVESYI